MGFHEDDRIRNKNKDFQVEEVKETQEFKLVLKRDISLAELLMLFTQDSKNKVSLLGKNTIVIE